MNSLIVSLPVVIFTFFLKNNAGELKQQSYSFNACT